MSEREYTTKEVLEELRKHEKGCDDRHAEIGRRFDKTDESIRHWGIGSVVFLTFVLGIMSVSMMIVIGNKPTIIPVPYSSHAQELQQAATPAIEQPSVRPTAQ